LGCAVKDRDREMNKCEGEREIQNDLGVESKSERKLEGERVCERERERAREKNCGEMVNGMVSDEVAHEDVLGQFLPDELTSVGLTVCLLVNCVIMVRWLNARYIGLPCSVIVALTSMVSSTAIFVMFPYTSHTDSGDVTAVASNLLTLQHVHESFSLLVLRWLLGFILFADATEVIFEDISLMLHKITLLAVCATATSSLLIASGTYILLRPLIPAASFSSCLLFGALISPTDPVSVISILRKHSGLLDRSLQVTLTGEALFNDVTSVLIFETILSFSQLELNTTTTSTSTIGTLVRLVAQQFVLGVLIGVVFGYAVYSLLALDVSSPVLEVGVTIAMVLNINVVCTLCNASIPLANVIAGLLIGNHGTYFAMSQPTRACFNWIWTFLGDSINAFLYTIVGFESYQWLFLWNYFGAHGIAIMFLIIPLSLSARFASVYACLTAQTCFSSSSSYDEQETADLLSSSADSTATSATDATNDEEKSAERSNRVKSCVVLTWGGLRGAISIALVLSIPTDYDAQLKSMFYLMTYAVVLFGLSAQALSFKYAISRFSPTTNKQKNNSNNISSTTTSTATGNGFDCEAAARGALLSRRNSGVEPIRPLPEVQDLIKSISISSEDDDEISEPFIRMGSSVRDAFEDGDSDVEDGGSSVAEFGLRCRLQSWEQIEEPDETDEHGRALCACEKASLTCECGGWKFERARRYQAFNIGTPPEQERHVSRISRRSSLGTLGSRRSSLSSSTSAKKIPIFCREASGLPLFSSSAVSNFSSSTAMTTAGESTPLVGPPSKLDMSASPLMRLLQDARYHSVPESPRREGKSAMAAVVENERMPLIQNVADDCGASTASFVTPTREPKSSSKGHRVCSRAEIQPLAKPIQLGKQSGANNASADSTSPPNDTPTHARRPQAMHRPPQHPKR